MYSLYLLFVGLIVLAAVLMCFVVLIQNSKGGGLSSSFAASNQIMGVLKTTDFIEKLTWGLISLLLLLQLKILLLINKKDILQNERPSKKGRFFIVYKN